MIAKNSRYFKVGMFIAPFVLTFITTSLMLLIAGANPFQAYAEIIGGAFESPRKMADIAVAGVPLLLASAGMLITFAAGLWNIGVEGQIIAGALGATWVIQSISAPSYVMIPLSILGGLAGGALWGLLVGLLRTYGGVNEIFAGLGLNFVATALTNYLIFGPWKPEGGATMSGTAPFPREAWMPLLSGTRASPITIVLALVAIVAVYFVLKDTYWGLKLKAIGLNSRSAHRMGIATTRNMLLAFILCGALAGLAGATQATAVYRRLIPQISGGYGYLSQLVVLLSGLRAPWVLPIVLFFASIQVGSPRLELRLQLDSSLGGVLQASIVLFFLLVQGIRRRLEAGRE
ncbi:MAG TPA: ABC transporter permease [Chloroflexi bacterium]|nr:ABC transporter permease [Chloroflexota bacterium]